MKTPCYSVIALQGPMDKGDENTLANFVAGIDSPSGHLVLRVQGNEKELVRMAAGAIVAALNKAAGL